MSKKIQRLMEEFKRLFKTEPSVITSKGKGKSQIIVLLSKAENSQIYQNGEPTTMEIATLAPINPSSWNIMITSPKKVDGINQLVSYALTLGEGLPSIYCPSLPTRFDLVKILRKPRIPPIMRLIGAFGNPNILPPANIITSLCKKASLLKRKQYILVSNSEAEIINAIEKKFAEQILESTSYAVIKRKGVFRLIYGIYIN